MQGIAVWVGVLALVIVPLVAAATSPLLQWRDPIYIVAGFAGVIALVFLAFQPLLVAGFLPGVTVSRGRRVHRWVGVGLFGAVIVHVAGLWVTSPPDVVDALLFVSPTPFAAWGVIAMWAVFGAGLVAVFRRKLPFRPMVWRRIHTGFVALVIVGSVVHAMQIEGTMEIWSKAILCAFVVALAVRAVVELRIWTRSRSE